MLPEAEGRELNQGCFDDNRAAARGLQEWEFEAVAEGLVVADPVLVTRCKDYLRARKMLLKGWNDRLKHEGLI